MKTLSDQKKGSLLAFIAVMFITPDSLFIRLSNVDTWGLVFYRGIIPFLTVLIGITSSGLSTNVTTSQASVSAINALSDALLSPCPDLCASNSPIRLLPSR